MVLGPLRRAEMNIIMLEAPEKLKRGAVMNCFYLNRMGVRVSYLNLLSSLLTFSRQSKVIPKFVVDFC